MIKRISYLILGMVCCMTLAYGQQPPTFNVTPQNLTVDPNDNVSFTITVNDYSDFLSFQYSMNWDPSILEYSSVSDFNTADFPGLGTSSIGATNAVSNGQISVSWLENNLNVITAPNGAEVYTINFVAIASGTTSVAITEMPSVFEVIDSNDQDVGLNHNDATVTVTGDVTSGNTDPLGVSADNASGQNGTSVCVPIKVTNFDDVNAVQFSINYDASVLNYSSLQNFGLSGLEATDFTVPPSTVEGQIGIDWSSTTGVTIIDNSTLVEVCFDIVGTAPANSSISFTDTPTAINVTTVASNGQNVGLTSATGTVTVTPAGGGGNGGPLVIAAGNGSGDSGTDVCIPVTVSNFNEIISFQFSMNYDPAVLNFSSLQNFNLVDFDASGFNTPPQSTEGQIIANWFDNSTNGISLPDNTVLFEICFTTVGAGQTSATVNFTGTPTPIEVTTVDSDGVDVGLSASSGTISVTGDGGGNNGTGGELVVSAGSATGTTGTDICIPVTVRNFNDIVNFQYSINYNSSVLSFNGAQNFSLEGLNEGSFGNTNPGQITVSWLDDTTNGITVPDNTVLYELCFSLINGGSSTVSFTGTPTPIEVTTVESNGQDVGLVGNPGQITSEGDVVIDGLAFIAESETVLPGENFCIDVTVNDFTDLISFQYSMSWDPSVIQYTGIQGFGVPGLSEDGNFGSSGVENGSLTVSWLDDTTEGVTLPNGGVCFQVCFTAIGTIGQTSTFTFSGTPTAIEVVDNQENLLDPSFNNGTVTIGDMPTIPTANFTLTPPSSAVAIGDNFCMPLAVSNFTNISDMQFTVNYPANLLQVMDVQITGNLPGLGTAQVNSGTAGQVTINWTAPNGSETLANGTVILNLCFTVLQAGPNNSATITFSNANVNNADGNMVPFNGPQVMVPLGNPPVIFPIAASNVCAEPNMQICVPVKTFNFDDLISIQHTIEFDETVLQFVSVNITPEGSNLLDLAPSSFNTNENNISEGRITFAWFKDDLACVTVPDDTPIYELCFSVIGNAGQNSAIAFTNTPTSYEVITCQEEELDWLGQDGSVSIQSSCTMDCEVVETVTDVTCNGIDDGSISIALPGGCTGTYAWSNGAGNTPNITNLAAGNYTVTVTIGGQQIIETYQVNQPLSIGISPDPVDVTCFGDNNGSITLGVTGGTGGYTYNFSPGGATTNPATGLSAGTYSVTVMDGSNCMVTANNIVINEPAAALDASVANVTNVDCTGDATGAIDLAVTGGTPNYTYRWSDGPSTMNRTGLTAGTYVVTVTDNNGCIDIENVVVETSNPAISISNVATTPITGGGNNGGITVDVSGGTGAFNYTWSGPNDFTATTKDISGLNEPGMYLLTVTDQATGCTAFASAVLQNPLSINEGAAIVTATCFGQATGGVNISPMGGSTPYTFAWSNATAMEDLSGVAAGTYTVTITDSENTMVTATFMVTATNEINITGDVQADTGIDNGSVDLSVNGGSGTFTYQWSSGDTTEDIFNKDEGTYTVTITDTDSGCTQTQEFVIPLQEEPLALVTVQPEGVSCNGLSDGEVTIMIAGGSPSYAITFDPAVNGQPFFDAGGSEQTYTDLPGGSITVNVTDATGGVVSQVFTVPEPTSIVLEATTHVFDAINTVNCDGGINLEVSGGISPYTYSWTSSNGTVVPPVEDPGQLCPGVYTPMITDANGCIQTFSGLVVKEFSIQSQAASLTNPNCPGSATGSIELSVINGAAPLTFSWTNEAGEEVATTESLLNVEEGTYTLEVRDADGRTITDQFVLTANSNLAAVATLQTDYNGFGVTCADATDATIRVTPQNGTAPYTYDWSDGLGTNPVVTDAPGGLHVVTVTDNAGCATEAMVMVTAPPVINIDLNVEDISCHDENDGEIIAFASGGVGGFNYRWDDNVNGSTRFNLEGGFYSLEVTDINGCSVEAPTEIVNPDELTIETVATPITDTETGSATVIVAGGTQPYTFTWNDDLNTETQSLENISKEGTYVVIVSDDHGCVKVGDVEVVLLANCLKSRPVITPGDGELNEEFVINCVENYPGNTLEVYNRWGQLVFEAENYDNTWTGDNRRGNPLPEGGYFYVLTYKDVSGQLTQLKGSLSILRQ